MLNASIWTICHQRKQSFDDFQLDVKMFNASFDKYVKVEFLEGDCLRERLTIESTLINIL